MCWHLLRFGKKIRLWFHGNLLCRNLESTTYSPNVPNHIPLRWILRKVHIAKSASSLPTTPPSKTGCFLPANVKTKNSITTLSDSVSLPRCTYIDTQAVCKVMFPHSSCYTDSGLPTWQENLICFSGSRSISWSSALIEQTQSAFNVYKSLEMINS